VLPNHDIELDPNLPPDFRCWVPTEQDIADAGDEGLGFFRNTWLITEVAREEARQVVAEETTLIDLVDAVARDAAEFDLIASAVEWGQPDDLDIADVRQRPAWAALEAEFPGEEGLLSGLELGVGGLSHALAAAGLVPVASCRSHATDHSWSDAPVVFFATDRRRALILQRLVAEHRCGLDHDEVDRPQFMTITGPDVRTMNRLATGVLDAAEEFGPGTIVRKSSGSENDADTPVDPDQFVLPGLPVPGPSH
jgi:hypothetical protein